ncbi:MAG: hypothetical protein EOP82_21670 [Variovorax sp.]|nr:MAG: hypothetical protein EOP82_21670 [Variovorax sp.]
MSIRPVKLGSMAPGLNNRLEPTQLAVASDDKKGATFLYAADNVDLNRKGYLKRRRGQTVEAAGQAHSLWSDKDGAFAVIDSALNSLTPSGAGLARASVRVGLPALPVSYSRGADGNVYWSNGQLIRRVVAGVDRPIAAEPPSLIPPINLISGALPAGKYLVAMTRQDENGESPATPVVQVDVPANGGIQILSADALQVYMSSADGDVLTLQGNTTGGALNVVTHTNNRRRCATLNRELMPAGTIVRHYNGCLLVASGNVLHVSEPYNYGLRNPSKGYIPFPEDITVIEPTANGVYLCADKTYWIADLLMEGALAEVLPYGGIPGTSGRFPREDKVFWQSSNGLVVGDKAGAAKAAQEGALEFSGASSGASLYRERDGMHHIVSTRFGVEPSVAAATSFMDARIVRKGTIL